MCGLLCSPTVCAGLSVHECGATGSASSHIACPVHPTIHQSLGPAQATRVLSALAAWLPFSTPPTGLDEYFFFMSLVVGLPYGLIFCLFWLFLFLNCCPSFGCARRHSVSTYASILVLKSDSPLLVQGKIWVFFFFLCVSIKCE